MRKARSANSFGRANRSRGFGLRYILLVMVLGAIGGGVYLAVVDLPAPTKTESHTIDNERFFDKQ